MLLSWELARSNIVFEKPALALVTGGSAGWHPLSEGIVPEVGGKG